MFAFNVFSNVCECVAKEVTNSTLVVSLAVVSVDIMVSHINNKHIKYGLNHNYLPL